MKAHRFLTLTAAMLASCLAFLGCGNGKTSQEPSADSQRVIAVQPDKEANPLERLCEVQHKAGKGPAFAFPDVTTAAPSAAPGWQWVNVWATWCKPCVEELPMLIEWQKKLHDTGAKVELRFLSVDATDELVAQFRQAHPGTPETLRMSDPASLVPWATKVGLDPGATLPIHLFVDSSQHVRCARTGSVGTRDYDLVKGLVTGG